MKNKFIVIISSFIGVFILTGAFVPTTLTAPGDARVIVDHTQKVYMSPPCFDDANATNHVQETTYAEAKKLGYLPDSACTSETLQEEGVSIVNALLKVSGILENKWSSSIWEK